MKSKRALMGFAALLILIFHFYPVSTSILRRSAFIGVDLFFFVSALSLGRKKEIPFFSFALNRLQKVYLPFVIFCVVAAVYKKWKLKDFLQTVFGAKLFSKGGGSFLWFLPGIIIFYLLVPIILKAKKRFGLWALLGGLVFWAAIAAVLQYGFGYTTIFILLNRLPIFLIGLFYDLLRSKEIKLPIRIPVTMVVLILGFVLLKQNLMLKVPFADMYYLVAIPLTLAIAECFELVYSIPKLKLHLLEFIGGCTLEIYCLQMIFGYDIMLFALKQNGKQATLAFLITVVAVILPAIAIMLAKKYLTLLFSLIGGKKE